MSVRIEIEAAVQCCYIGFHSSLKMTKAGRSL